MSFRLDFLLGYFLKVLTGFLLKFPSDFVRTFSRNLCYVFGVVSETFRCDRSEISLEVVSRITPKHEEKRMSLALSLKTLFLVFIKENEWEKEKSAHACGTGIVLVVPFGISLTRASGILARIFHEYLQGRT